MLLLWRGSCVCVPCSPTSRRGIMHAGDLEALRKYHEDHKQQLQERAAKMREEGKQLARATGHAIPFTNSEWLEWLDSHSEDWGKYLSTSSKKRRAVSNRVQVDHALPAVPRLQAVKAPSPKTTWARKKLHAKQGFFHIDIPDGPQDSGEVQNGANKNNAKLRRCFSQAGYI